MPWRKFTHQFDPIYIVVRFLLAYRRRNIRDNRQSGRIESETVDEHTYEYIRYAKWYLFAYYFHRAECVYCHRSSGGSNHRRGVYASWIYKINIVQWWWTRTQRKHIKSNGCFRTKFAQLRLSISATQRTATIAVAIHREHGELLLAWMSYSNCGSQDTSDKFRMENWKCNLNESHDEMIAWASWNVFASGETRSTPRNRLFFGHNTDLLASLSFAVSRVLLHLRALIVIHSIYRPMANSRTQYAHRHIMAFFRPKEIRCFYCSLEQLPHEERRAAAAKKITQKRNKRCQWIWNGCSCSCVRHR